MLLSNPNRVFALAGGKFLIMKRREFMTLLGGAAAAWPLATRAQQGTVPVVGFLHYGSPEPNLKRVAAFRKALSESGFTEGQNVAIEFSWAAGQDDRLQELAADLVRRRVAAIATPGSTPAALAAKAATTTIPIVFAVAGDPVALGLVASLNRPGSNLTGFTFQNVELMAKRLGLLHEVVPGAARVVALVNPNSPLTETIIKDLQAVAPPLGLQIEILYAGTDREIDAVFANLVPKSGGALLVSPDAFFFDHRAQLVSLAALHTLPVIYSVREFTEDGGLMSYGTDLVNAFRETGIYMARILNGEKPADLPVLQPTKFELVINLKTAKALGLTVPLIMQMTADEVIE
jgi:putative tryptophan/tyrosine transport system substrate-binding protein